MLPTPGYWPSSSFPLAAKGADIIRIDSFMNHEREIWNAMYAQESHASLVPDPFLIEAYENYVAPLLGEGTSGLHAIDLAGGVGRHAIWMAQRGWQVTLVDVSDEAVAIAKRNAGDAEVSLDLRLEGLEEFVVQAEEEQFDLILVFFFLQRELFPAFIKILKPGGIILYKTYTVEQLKLRPGQGPSHPMHLLKSNELLRAFSSLEVQYYRETVKDRGVAELVARKPA